MASITTYFRLEPDPLRPDVTIGATAPVHDPLWLLARQWQLGEFAAQDGGTPVVARWRGVAAEPTRFVAGPIPPNTQLQAPGFAALAAPLETLIERAGPPLPSTAETLAGLRLGVKNGGCAGMSYTMEWAETAGPHDEVVEDKGVRVLVDPKAVLFLLGTRMDFRTDKLSSGFVFENPNQTSACGCGESVAITPAVPDQLVPTI